MQTPIIKFNFSTGSVTVVKGQKIEVHQNWMNKLFTGKPSNT